MRRPRSERMPAGQAGIWHIVSRCVRRARLLENEGRREWLCSALAGWLDLLAVDLLGYALMGNHIHLIVRTRPDLAAEWTPGQVRRRQVAASLVVDGHPSRWEEVGTGSTLTSEQLSASRDFLSHPGAMLRAVKEGLARRINRDDKTAGHVWESRYQDVALLDAGAVLACQVYVDLNPFRAGLVDAPQRSDFCSARHRRALDGAAPDVVLARRLQRRMGHPVLDWRGRPRGTWAWSDAELAELTAATASMIRSGAGSLPAWAVDLLPRLGVQTERWSSCHAQPGMLRGTVLAAHATRVAMPGTRMPSDKSGLFGILKEAQ